MMLFLSLLTLSAASISALLSLNSREEIFRVAMGCVALLFALVTLLVAPWALKLTLAAIPLIWERVNWANLV
ncbi:MAG: riboflavin synthase subunit alpha [Microcystaceae cyanobacterium]